MGRIKKLYESTPVGESGSPENEVYPITAAKAVYMNGGSNIETLIQQLSAGYKFLGIVDENTEPNTSIGKVFYIAPEGAWPNFGEEIEVPAGSFGVFSYDGSWTYSIITITSGGGGGGASLAQMWSSLEGNSGIYTDALINVAHIPIDGSTLVATGGKIQAVGGSDSLFTVDSITNTVTPKSGYVGISTPILYPEGSQSKIGSSQKLWGGIFASKLNLGNTGIQENSTGELQISYSDGGTPATTINKNIITSSTKKHIEQMVESDFNPATADPNTIYFLI